MNISLADTLEYDDETLEYDRSYFVRGVMNHGMRVYEGDEYTVHFNPETGLAKVTDGEGFATRVEAKDPPYKSDETVVLVDRN